MRGPSMVCGNSYVFNVGILALPAKVFISSRRSEKNMSEFFIKLNLFIFNSIVLFFWDYLSRSLGAKTPFHLGSEV